MNRDAKESFAAGVEVGVGAFRYRAAVGWPRLPPDLNLVEVAAVATDEPQIAANEHRDGSAGMSIRQMHEPAPPPGFLARATEYEDAATIPRLLFMHCERT